MSGHYSSVLDLGMMLAPLPIFVWGELALSHRGIPTAIGVST